jgi:hypothetical protein
LFAHDLRANAFRVCREGKPLHTFPDHALSPRGVFAPLRYDVLVVIRAVRSLRRLWETSLPALLAAHVLFAFELVLV